MEVSRSLNQPVFEEVLVVNLGIIGIRRVGFIRSMRSIYTYAEYATS